MWKGHFVYVSTWLRLAKSCNLCVFETYSWGYGICRQHIRIDKYWQLMSFIAFIKQNQQQCLLLTWLQQITTVTCTIHMTSIELWKGFVGLYVFSKYKICATWIIYQIHIIYNTQHMNNEFLNIGLVIITFVTICIL